MKSLGFESSNVLQTFDDNGQPTHLQKVKLILVEKE